MLYRLKSLWAFFLALAVSCGNDPAIDIGKPWDLASGAPRILEVTYLRQSPAAKQVLVFEIKFEDADGDIAEGHVEIFLNQSKANTTRLPLKPLMLQNEVPLGAKLGSFLVPVEIFLSGPGSEAQREMKFEIGLQLTDGSGDKSNLAKIRLRAEKP
jgi:hypothetical protein